MNKFFSIGKRIGLFLAVNILVMVTISIVLNVLGVQPYLTAKGINYQSLMAFCLVWGFGGAFISLALSRMMAKWMMGVKVIDPFNAPANLQNLVNVVHQLAHQAGISKMPEVGVYDSPEVNAFATGPTKNRSLVAVSTGLLRSMNQKEIEGVLGHEIAHIANGDMVTMTLIQGVVNAFVMFIARIIAYAVSMNVKEESRHIVNMLVTIGLEIVLGLLGAIVVAYFSRRREFRADAGGAQLAGRDSMIASLRSLSRTYGIVENQPSIATLKISGKSKGLMSLFATHPPIELRIARLENLG